MFPIYAPNDASKAADFRGTPNWNSEMDGWRFSSAVTSTTSTSREKLHQSSGVDPLGEAELRGEAAHPDLRDSHTRPFHTSPAYRTQTSAFPFCRGVYYVIVSNHFVCFFPRV